MFQLDGDSLRYPHPVEEGAVGVFTALVHQRPIPLGPDPAVPSGNPRFPVAAERDIRLRPGCARPPKLGPSGIRGRKYAIWCRCPARVAVGLGDGTLLVSLCVFPVPPWNEIRVR